MSKNTNKTISITTLKKQMAKVEKERHRLRDLIEEAETKAKLPSLKAKYEGRYFKYNNGTGQTERWWFYMYCIRVESVHRAIFNTFQTTPYQREFNVASEEGLHLCEKEITRMEYLDALAEFQKAVHQL